MTKYTSLVFKKTFTVVGKASIVININLYFYIFFYEFEMTISIMKFNMTFIPLVRQVKKSVVLE